MTSSGSSGKIIYEVRKMLNIVAIVGRLGKDPELRTTQSGKSVTSFSLAVQRPRKNQSGEYESDWIDVQAWGTTAEFICKYFQQGQLMAVSGRIQTRVYTDRDGKARKGVEIVAQDVSFCEGRKREEPVNPPSSFSRDAEPLKEYEQQAMLPPDDFLGDDDLPFD